MLGIPCPFQYVVLDVFLKPGEGLSLNVSLFNWGSRLLVSQGGEPLCLICIRKSVLDNVFGERTVTERIFV